MTASIAQDKLDKVRKLLAKADSVKGTPEADVFNAKAFELIAQYGIDEAEARRRDGEGPEPIIVKVFTITGQYQPQQRTLLQYLATALHCSPIVKRNDDGTFDTVYGAESHMQRLDLLFSTLSMQMMGGARKITSTVRGISTTTSRKSWMTGFAFQVSELLTEKEGEASAAESAAGTALVFVDDAKRAHTALRSELNGRIKTTKLKSQVDRHAQDQGRAAGRNVDLGGTRIRGQRALSA